MSLAGMGAVAIWHDLLPEAKPNFYEWHNREHMPERAGIPGFRRGRRYIALVGAPEYFNLYEAESPEVLVGQDYLQRLNAPTPWTRETVQAFRNVARSICRVLYTQGEGQGGVMATLRFDVEGDAQAEAGLTRMLRQQLLPPLADRPGIAGVHLCRADDAGSRIETAEKKARSDGTLVPRWVLLVEGSGAQPVQAVLDEAQAALRAQPGVRALEAAVYQLQHQRCKLPWGDR